MTMNTRSWWLRLLQVFPFVAGAAGAARADTLDLLITVVDEAKMPVVGLPMRVVFSDDEQPRAPGSGQRFVTDDKGRVRQTRELSLKQRRVELDIPFVRHKTEMFDIGVEPALGGTPLLYTLELDTFKVNTLISAQQVYRRGTDGRFSDPVNLDWEVTNPPNEYRVPPLDAKFNPIADVPPARLGRRALTLIPHPRVDGSRRWTLDLRLAVVPYRPEGMRQ
ncbi:hypothetical protein DFR24_4774 [Panacagrimonas perspica]|uniref:Protein BatD n=1 Tax=Panacagrimonas perspica TaxID=381431 RepID=A0A4R7NRR6_9GAMM|nr:hypothetical protein [Panacagrimonas perspica]TDU23251.1 hypothetical protein DFR24_4774 [Panacagrimonas perspica]